jgi:hypothetical protein
MSEDRRVACQRANKTDGDGVINNLSPPPPFAAIASCRLSPSNHSSERRVQYDRRVPKKHSMTAKDTFRAFGAFGGILLSVSVALTIAGIASSTGEIKSQMESYISGKGFFAVNDDLYALVLVPSDNDFQGAKESSSRSSIATHGARKRLQAAVETMLPAGKDLVRTAASQLAAEQAQSQWETATVEIFFENNSTMAASGILVGVETLKEAKTLATTLSKLVKGHPLPGGGVHAVRLTAASCETTFSLYPTKFRLLQSVPVVGRLFSTPHEQAFNDKRVRISTLSLKERYKCLITATGYGDGKP